MEKREPGRFLEHLEKLRDKWLHQMEEQADLGRTDEPLHPQLFAKAIGDRADDDAFFARLHAGNCPARAGHCLAGRLLPPPLPLIGRGRGRQQQ